jgi:ketosteroid isomerase-like protein
VNATISDSGIIVATGRSARAAAIDIVRDFVEALARRDLVAARRHLTADFRMTVPGNHSFRTLEEFAAFSQTRTGAVRKQTEGFDACEVAIGIAVYTYGTMSGTWLDGSEFAAVRYIDRLLLRDDRIVEMQVWSDMAEFRPR